MWFGAAALAPVLLFPFIRQPVMGLVLGGIALAVLAAWRTPALPLALAGLPGVSFALLGPNPLPAGGVSAVLAVWTGIGVAFVIMRGRDVPPPRVGLAAPVVLTVLLGLLMLARLPAETLSDYGGVKFQLFVVGNAVFVVGGVFIGWRPRDLNVLLLVSLAVATLTAVVLVVRFGTGGATEVLPGRFSISPEDDPIGLARGAAEGLLIAVYLMLSRRAATTRLWAVAALPALAIAVVASGSRGPVVGLTLGLVVLLALALTHARARRRLLVVAGAALIAVVAVVQTVPTSTLSRSLEVIVASGTDLSSNGRSQLWAAAWEGFLKHPFGGLGTGGFADLRAAEIYPHNLLLEAAVELGIVGLLIVAAMLVWTFVRIGRAWRIARDEDRLLAGVVAALFSMAVVNALFSSAMPNNKEVWLWSGVVAGLSARLLRDRGASRR
ncbi:MAG: O-antigen ligase family protein [Actinomycetota bacterium]|nr:O-antigen ligase family protein [Actinomycetota bacterium]